MKHLRVTVSTIFHTVCTSSTVLLICQSISRVCSLSDDRKTTQTSLTFSKKRTTWSRMTWRLKIMELVIFKDESKKTLKMFLRWSADTSQGDPWFMIPGCGGRSLCMFWVEGRRMTRVCEVPQILDWIYWSDWISRPLRTVHIPWPSVTSLKATLTPWWGILRSIINLSFCTFVTCCAAGRLDDLYPQLFGTTCLALRFWDNPPFLGWPRFCSQINIIPSHLELKCKFK